VDPLPLRQVRLERGLMKAGRLAASCPIGTRLAAFEALFLAEPGTD
jgi:hypothetical protein